MIHDLLIEPIEQPTPEGLFIMVVEEEYLKLSQHITQTAIRMYATAKKHGYNLTPLPTLIAFTKQPHCAEKILSVAPLPMGVSGVS